MDFKVAIVAWSLLMVLCILWIWLLFTVSSFVASYLGATGLVWWAITIVGIFVLSGLTYSIGSRCK